jgi:hypothetical protein
MGGGGDGCAVPCGGGNGGGGSMMEVKNLDIPKMAWLEHEVFMEAHRLNAFAIANGNVLESKGLGRDSVPPPPYRQTRILSCLYMIFVFPKELWAGTSIGENVIESLTKNSFLKTLADDDVKKFLRHIRNSIAHARINVLPDGSAEFIDKDSSGKIKFRKTLDFSQVQGLLSVVGSAFANLRENPNRTEGLEQLRSKSWPQF